MNGTSEREPEAIGLDLQAPGSSMPLTVNATSAWVSAAQWISGCTWRSARCSSAAPAWRRAGAWAVRDRVGCRFHASLVLVRVGTRRVLFMQGVIRDGAPGQGQEACASWRSHAVVVADSATPGSPRRCRSCRSGRLLDQQELRGAVDAAATLDDRHVGLVAALGHGAVAGVATRGRAHAQRRFEQSGEISQSRRCRSRSCSCSRDSRDHRPVAPLRRLRRLRHCAPAPLRRLRRRFRRAPGTGSMRRRRRRHRRRRRTACARSAAVPPAPPLLTLAPPPPPERRRRAQARRHRAVAFGPDALGQAGLRAAGAAFALQAFVSPCSAHGARSSHPAQDRPSARLQASTSRRRTAAGAMRLLNERSVAACSCSSRSPRAPIAAPGPALYPQCAAVPWVGARVAMFPGSRASSAIAESCPPVCRFRAPPGATAPLLRSLSPRAQEALGAGGGLLWLRVIASRSSSNSLSATWPGCPARMQPSAHSAGHDRRLIDRDQRPGAEHACRERQQHEHEQIDRRGTEPDAGRCSNESGSNGL